MLTLFKNLPRTTSTSMLPPEARLMLVCLWINRYEDATIARIARIARIVRILRIVKTLRIVRFLRTVKMLIG